MYSVFANQKKKFNNEINYWYDKSDKGWWFSYNAKNYFYGKGNIKEWLEMFIGRDISDTYETDRILSRFISVWNEETNRWEK